MLTLIGAAPFSVRPKHVLLVRKRVGQEYPSDYMQVKSLRDNVPEGKYICDPKT